jgi:uncharacterized RDD family membrane protein YckC
MLFPFAKKKNKEKIEYSGFNSRLFTSCIDLFIISVFSMPLFMAVSYIMYGGSTPNVVIPQIIQEISLSGERVQSLSEILNNQKIREYLFDNHGLFKIILDFVFQISVLLAFFVVFWYKKQATPGQMILSYKIVDASTLQSPSLKQLIIRVFAIVISIAFFGLGIIWIAFDKRKQGWHDKLANTLIIKKNIFKK